uniref:Uncharacterized protein n=1 Tax=Rhipicephalus appendiculatus TaxID=34631 RepID=A0A131YNA3_RHIAP
MLLYYETQTVVGSSSKIQLLFTLQEFLPFHLLDSTTVISCIMNDSVNGDIAVYSIFFLLCVAAAQRVPPARAVVNSDVYIQQLPLQHALMQHIQQFVREEVARQLSLVPYVPTSAHTLTPTLRKAIEEQVSDALPPTYHPSPISAPLTYAEVARRP